jgi:hypothetical protein
MKHLFIDDQIVERIDNLARKLHQPEKFEANAVVRPEHLWENIAIQIRGAPAWAPDEELFKMIYLTSAEAADRSFEFTATGDVSGDGFYCYATSTDGVNWEKPFLGLHDYPALLWNGQPIGGRNNILPSAQGLLLAPIYDASDPDPDRRYKGMGWPPNSDGLRPAISANGVHWKFLDVTIRPAGDEAQLNHDESGRRFILTLKRSGPYGRSVYLSTSEDFEHWSEPELIFHADQQDQENGKERLARFLDDPAYLRPVFHRPEEYRTDVYHMAAFPYEGLYLGMPVMFHWAGKHPPMYENVDGRKTIELTSSRDLRHWNRVANRAPFMQLSPVGDGSAYDTGQLEPASHPILRNDELWFYYTGLRDRCQTLGEKLARGYLDSGAVCMARLRLDGFVSLKGGIEWGSVLTRPLVVEGRELHVNVDSWRGQVRAEILDAAGGQPISGFSRDESIPAVIDRIDVPLRWKQRSDLSELRGSTVRIRFWVQRAELYAFWFAG